jgi:hypothetical protein
MKLLLSILSAALAIAATAKTIYIDSLATGAQDGTSWADAYTTVTSIPTTGASRALPGDEIEVAAGTYTAFRFYSSGTEADPIRVFISQDPAKNGIVRTSHIRIDEASHLHISGALDENYVPPVSVHDILANTNNVGIYITHNAHLTHGIRFVGNITNSIVEWMKPYLVGTNTLPMYSTGEPQENAISVTEVLTDCVIRYNWFYDCVYGDAISGVRKQRNLRVHDNIFDGIGDDVIGFTGGYKFYRNYVTRSVYGLTQGHPDVFEAYTGDLWLHHNIFKDWGATNVNKVYASISLLDVSFNTNTNIFIYNNSLNNVQGNSILSRGIFVGSANPLESLIADQIFITGNSVSLFTNGIECFIGAGGLGGGDIGQLYIKNNSIFDCTEATGALGGVGIFINDTSTSPSVIDYLEITGNAISSEASCVYLKDATIAVYYYDSTNTLRSLDANIYLEQTISVTSRLGNINSISYALAAPVSGTWRVGDIVYNTAPAPSGFIGFVCTVAGTPGTWKTFGAISA